MGACFMMKPNLPSLARNWPSLCFRSSISAGFSPAIEQQCNEDGQHFLKIAGQQRFREQRNGSGAQLRVPLQVIKHKTSRRIFNLDPACRNLQARVKPIPFFW
ncbi:MAG: hypothetical protein KDD04_08405 [Sinomicrobium sp.]|nr:hypothetical protein [Sinomicrobium sp.]